MDSIVCSVIDVECYSNDPDDIRFRTPRYLGFEFLVRKKDRDVMTNYVKCMLNEYGISYVNINNRHYRIVNEKDIHTADMIRRIIESSKDNEELRPNNYCKKLVK